MQLCHSASHDCDETVLFQDIASWMTKVLCSSESRLMHKLLLALVPRARLLLMMATGLFHCMLDTTFSITLQTLMFERQMAS
jgi:hypothetical protein